MKLKQLLRDDILKSNLKIEKYKYNNDLDLSKLPNTISNNLKKKIEKIKKNNHKYDLNNTANSQLNNNQIKPNTLDIIKKIYHKKREDNSYDTIFEDKKISNDIISEEFKLFDKYDQLLEGNFLQLPISLKKYLKLFEILDTCLMNILNLENSVFFEKIKDFIYKNKSYVIKLKNLQKILFISPWAYKVIFSFNEKNKKDDYLLLFNEEYKSKAKNNNFFKNRVNRFKNDLYNYTYENYVEFCNQNNINLEDSDNFESLKLWHPKFKLDEIKIRNLFELPSKENIIIKSINQHLKEEETKYIKNIDDIFNSSNESEDELKENGFDQFKCYINKKLLQDYINKKIESKPSKGSSIKEKILWEIQLKEEFMKKAELKSDDNSSNKINKSILVEIVKKLKIYYKMRKVSNMFIIKVIEYLNKNLTKTVSLKEIEDYIIQIIKISPEWGKIIMSNQQRILNLAKNNNLEAVLNSINNY